MKKTVLVTGASRGIGAATAQLFAENGWNVVLNYNKSEAQALALAEKIGAVAVKADITKPDEIQNMLNVSRVRFGSIDVLVNNAGIAQQKLFTDITENDWDNMFNVNIKSMFMVTKAVVRDMIRNRRGHIINISSIWGIAGASCEVHYSASKAAVIGFTKALAKELGLSKIAVNCIAPGVIDTQMNSHLDQETLSELKDETPLGKIGTGADIAKTALFLAESEFITGQIISPNGGIVI